jgi:hypothetical protein
MSTYQTLIDSIYLRTIEFNKEDELGPPFHKLSTFQDGFPHAEAADPSLSLRREMISSATFTLQAQNKWDPVDLLNNAVPASPVAAQETYIQQLTARLAQKRLVTDANAVGALGFCIPLSNESPSYTCCCPF